MVFSTPKNGLKECLSYKGKLSRYTSTPYLSRMINFPAFELNQYHAAFFTLHQLHGPLGSSDSLVVTALETKFVHRTNANTGR